MARFLMAAVTLAVVSMTSVAQAQVNFGGNIPTQNGTIGLNTRLDLFGITNTQAYVGRNLQSQSIQAAGLFGQVQGNTTNFSRGNFQTQTQTYNGSGPLGQFQANSVNVNGRSYTQATINGPLGATTNIQQFGGPNGKLNLIQRTDANGRVQTFIIPTR